jgi:cellulose synthase/poly-beta-1,6-N-acetylglucosamine synthase-like glycosyltransferase
MKMNSLILLVEFIPVMVNSIFFEYLLLFTRFVYLICAGVLFLYGLNCIILSSIYLINRKKIWSKSKLTNLVQKPIVSIQLPIYNEGRLVIGLLKHITQLDYPKEKMQIQVLDDSTDETRQLLKQLVLQYKDKGYWIEYAHRKTQTGYKAGNLAYGLEKAKGAFIVVFDADYEPNPDVLK